MECGLSAESTPHTTMHLQNSLNLDGYANLTRTPCEGIDFDSYIIYKAPKGGKLQEVKTASSERTSWTDSEKYVDGDQYRVAVVLKESFMPNMLKSDSGPYSQSLSNLAEAVVASEVRENSINATLYPNPATGKLLVTLENGQISGLSVSSLSGQNQQIAESANNSSTELDISDLPVGTYILTINTQDKAIQKLFTKE